MNSPGTISVIVPVFNGEIFIAEAIKNIQQQSYLPYEIIIIDDGSSDNTAKIIANCKGNNICYHYQNNKGPAAARNLGLRLAKGNVIAFLDVDDLWSQNKLELQWNYLIEDPLNEIIVGKSQIMVLKNTKKGSSFIEQGVADTYYLIASYIIKKSVFDKIGYFDETLLYCEDLEWFERARIHGINIKMHEEITHYYRRHSNNMTNKIELKNKYMLKAARKMIALKKVQQRCDLELNP